MNDAEEVREGVEAERAFDRLIASLYNRPTPFSGVHRPTSHGTRFLRWHELDAVQKKRVKDEVYARLDELDLRVTVIHD